MPRSFDQKLKESGEVVPKSHYSQVEPHSAFGDAVAGGVLYGVVSPKQNTTCLKLSEAVHG